MAVASELQQEVHLVGGQLLIESALMPGCQLAGGIEGATMDGWCTRGILEWLEVEFVRNTSSMRAQSTVVGGHHWESVCFHVIWILDGSRSMHPRYYLSTMDFKVDSRCVVMVPSVKISEPAVGLVEGAFVGDTVGVSEARAAELWLVGRFEQR